MIHADVLGLIGADPRAHGVFDHPQECVRTVYCTVRSASYRDIAAAGTDGLRPELIFRLAHSCEYLGEQRAEYQGRIYNIDRTYIAADSDWIELTCSRGDPNV